MPQDLPQPASLMGRLKINAHHYTASLVISEFKKQATGKGLIRNKTLIMGEIN